MIYEDENINAEFFENLEKKEKDDKKVKAYLGVFLSFYTILVIVIYMILGVLVDWHPYWIIFFTVPLFYSLIEAILRKKPQLFSIEFLAIIVYIILGEVLGVWHPTWIVLLVIPLYRSILSAIKKIKYIKNN
ncbi:MAG: hypothetical protein ACOX5X_01840 [Acholeplasmataceae bacterium]|jgi:HTH-type transcriptional regulator/antitoxin HipB